MVFLLVPLERDDIEFSLPDMSEQVVVRGVAAMHGLAQRMAEELTAGDLLLLTGDLGSGKTTFVQGLAQALGVAEAVTSPTFTIVGEYSVTGHATIKTLVHVDLYRLAEAEAQRDLVVQEVLSQAGEGGRLTVVEWADRLGDQAPAAARRLAFSHGSTEQTRVVSW